MFDKKPPAVQSDQHYSPEEVRDESGSEFSAQNHALKTSVQRRSTEEIIVSWIQAVGTLIVSCALGWLTYQQVQIASANRTQDLNIANDNRKQDSDKARDEQQHEIMSNYLNEMTNLLLEHDLRESTETDEVRTVARSVTWNAARRLDPERKGQLLKFLYEANLIGACPPSPKDNPFQIVECPDDPDILVLNEVTLEGARFPRPMEFSGINLEGVVLSNAQLNRIGLKQAIMNRAVLTGADLTGAGLQKAQMKGAQLNGAFMSKAELGGANLANATLVGTKLLNATLIDTDLRCAQLQGADLRGANLERAKLKGATYNGETKFPGNFDKKSHGMKYVEIGHSYFCEGLK